MNRSKFLFVLIATVVNLLHYSSQISTPEDLNYIAGVVEFEPALTGTPESRLQTNLNGYRDIIQSLQAQSTDLIVFPESTLNNDDTLTFVPDPADQIAPCGLKEYENFLSLMSCYAKSSKKYILINISEKANCTTESQAASNDDRPCSTDGLNKYNTNVVFNRKGEVISRYRKVHLYGENKNTTAKPELATFETDFGVKFGHFTCFDILFYTPAQDIVNSGVTDFLYPTMWFSELPFLTAVQTQQSWAYANDVNLLAAGASNPARGSTGTGIYAGKKGALISKMELYPMKSIHVVIVPKRGYMENTTKADVDMSRIVPETESFQATTGITLLKDKLLEQYTTLPLNSTDSIVNETVCNSKFCCTFNVKTKALNVPPSYVFYEYRLAVFSGVRTYQGIERSVIKACAVLACTTKDESSCATAFGGEKAVTSKLLFENIKIEGHFHKSKKSLIMPNSVEATTLLPLSSRSFTFDIKDEGDHKHVSYELTEPKANFLTFGIYANYFDGNSSASAKLSSFLLIISAIFVIFFLRFK